MSDELKLNIRQWARLRRLKTTGGFAIWLRRKQISDSARMLIEKWDALFDEYCNTPIR